MLTPLTLVEITEDGSPVSIGMLEGRDVLIGREPPSGIAVNNSAISRTHGIFSPVRDHWTFRDLGSTNGSWVNGVQAAGGQWYEVRAGDVIQLADLALRLDASPNAADEGARKVFPSLLVFNNELFVEEYPIPDYGRALVVGGQNGDLQIEGRDRVSPDLVLEKQKERLVASRYAEDLVVTVNDREVTDTAPLLDRDAIKIGVYLILFVDPAGEKTEPDRYNVAGESASPFEPVKGVSEGGITVAIPDVPAVVVEPSMRPGLKPPTEGVQLFPAGKRPLTDGDPAATTIADEDRIRRTLAGYNIHPGMQQPSDFGDDGFSPTEKKLIAVIVILLLLTVLFLVSWWLFL